MSIFIFDYGSSFMIYTYLHFPFLSLLFLPFPVFTCRLSHSFSLSLSRQFISIFLYLSSIAHNLFRQFLLYLSTLFSLVYFFISLYFACWRWSILPNYCFRFGKCSQLTTKLHNDCVSLCQSFGKSSSWTREMTWFFFRLGKTTKEI